MRGLDPRIYRATPHASDPAAIAPAITLISNRRRKASRRLCSRASTSGSVGSRHLCSRLLADAIQRFVEGVRTLPKPLAFLVGHFGFEHLDRAAAADDARQGQRDAKPLLIAADRNDRALVVEHHLGDPGRYDADAVLAGIMALDDGDVGVAHVFLQLLPQLVHPLAALLEQCRHRNSADP